MAFCYECVAITHIGTRRKNHEDNFYIGGLLNLEEQSSLSQNGRTCIKKSLTADNAKNHIFAVSDGMGGHKNGEVASCMVVDALRDFADARQEKAFHRRQEKFAYIQDFQEMIRQTNRKMLECSEEDRETERMGATLSGVILFADEMVPFNIGDSSTFLFENGMLRKLTVDDNEAAWSGKKRTDENEDGGLDFRGRRLTKYFGLPESSGILTAAISTPISIRKDQEILIASDGLTDSLSNEKIAEILADDFEDVGKAADKLIENVLTTESGGRDNITAVLVKIQRPTAHRYKILRQR